MMGAYAYLVLRSLRNRLFRQVARLRSPRYLIARYSPTCRNGHMLVYRGRA